MKQRRPWRLPKVLTFLSALLLAWPVNLPAPAAAEQPFAEAKIRELVEGLQNGTLPPYFVSEACRLEMQSDPKGEDLREIMTTYLEVPPELALSAFCDALVAIVRSGDVTLEGLLRIARNEKDAAMGLEVGRFLRAIFYAHRRTSTASLEGATAQ